MKMTPPKANSKSTAFALLKAWKKATVAPPAVMAVAHQPARAARLRSTRVSEVRVAQL